jgi:hypothetical protein
VDVGLRTVARVPALAERVTCSDVIADSNLDRAIPQVGKQDEGTTMAQCQNDMVASDGRGALSHPPRLSERIWQEGELRPPGVVVNLAVVSDNDPSCTRGENRAAESDEPLRALS